MIVDDTELDLLETILRKAMLSASGAELDAALTDVGWPDMLADIPDVVIPLAFRLLGETGAHASLINDVVLAAMDLPAGAAPALPYAGGRWVRWERWERGEPAGTVLDPELPIHVVDSGGPIPLSAGRRALGWWLVGTGTAMLSLARAHALSRTQFGQPISGFQAVRHRLAETLVALEGAQAALAHADDPLGALLAKAAAGQAALTAARHCQQVLGGIGFTAEHDLHRHVRRALVLDCLLGSARELTREAGAVIRTQRCAPRLAQL